MMLFVLITLWIFSHKLGFACSNPSFHPTWWFIGPFAVGKTEIDVDPLLTSNVCDRYAILRMQKGCPRKFYSELVASEQVSWIKPVVSGDSTSQTVAIQFPLPNSNVDFNGLIQGLNKISVLEFQGWATNILTIDKTGTYQITLKSVHSYYLDNVLYAGSIYSDSHFSNVVYLSKGKHYLDVKIRAKGSLQFTSFISYIPQTIAMQESFLRLGQMSHSQHLTDIVDGSLPFNEPSWIQLPLTNLGDDWCTDIDVEVTSVMHSKGRGGGHAPTPVIVNIGSIGTSTHKLNIIAPRHTQYISFQFQLDMDSDVDEDGGDNAWFRRTGDSPCLTFSVIATAQRNGTRAARGESNAVSMELRCRHSGQSFVFTLKDHDGSVTHAAAILPRNATYDTSVHDRADSVQGYPVLLSLSGVGVSARAQADSHKFKNAPKDKNYKFGFESAWILAPDRAGAHNWEGTGYWTALHTLEYLGRVTASKPALKADVSRVVVSGHSRGGHGALTFATHLPDRITGVVSASGYMDRENYGDANILFDMDVQLQYMDPLLLALHLAVLHEHDNAQSLENLQGVDVMVRSGSADRTVNVFFQRQMARALHAQSVNVTYSEKAGADHWYWDFNAPEDGGVVFDPMTRKFMEDHLPNLSDTSTTGQKSYVKFTVASHNPATFGSKHGITIDSMVSRLKKATVTVTVSAAGDSQCVWTLRADNVQSFTVGREFWRRVSCPSGGTLILGGVDFLVVSVMSDTSLCRSSVRGKDLRWSLCDHGGGEGSGRRVRRPSEQGPARQAFQHPFLVVVGTGSTAFAGADSAALTANALMDAAKYISVGHAMASDTVAPIVPDYAFDDMGGLDVISEYNLILIGGPDVNSVSERLMAAVGDMDSPLDKVSTSLDPSCARANASRQWRYDSFPPVRFVRDAETGRQSIALGLCHLSELAKQSGGPSDHNGIMFTFPLPHIHTVAFNDTCADGAKTSFIRGEVGKTGSVVGRGHNRLGIMVAAESLRGLQDVIAFSFSSNTPLTRAPFTNMYADYFAVGPMLQSRGLGGVLAAGYFGNMWDLDSNNGWFPDDCM